MTMPSGSATADAPAGGDDRSLPWCMPCEEFLRLIERERVRAGRNGRSFSLVTLDVGGLDEAAVREVRSRVHARRRMTDDVGWYEPGRLGVLLPETPGDRARSYLASVVELLGPLALRVAMRVYELGPLPPPGPPSGVPERRRS